MIVGVLKLSLVLPENHSLKGKRGVIKRIQARVADKFNISVGECGDQDLWQSAVLGFAVVGSSEPGGAGDIAESGRLRRRHGPRPGGRF